MVPCLRHSRGASVGARACPISRPQNAERPDQCLWTMEISSATSGRLRRRFSAVWGRKFGILGAYIQVVPCRCTSSRQRTVGGNVNRGREPRRLRQENFGQHRRPAMDIVAVRHGMHVPLMRVMHLEATKVVVDADPRKFCQQDSCRRTEWG
jgi:hypothetical protein